MAITNIDINQLSDFALKFASNPSIKHNAIINFTTSSGEVISYDDIGNPVITATNETQTILAYLWKIPSDRYINNQKSNTGTDQLANYYIGRLVDPICYDVPIRAVGEITVEINGRKGRLVELMNLETSSAISAKLQTNLGQRIHCFVEFFEGS